MLRGALKGEPLKAQVLCTLLGAHDCTAELHYFERKEGKCVFLPRSVNLSIGPLAQPSDEGKLSERCRLRLRGPQLSTRAEICGRPELTQAANEQPRRLPLWPQ